MNNWNQLASFRVVAMATLAIVSCACLARAAEADRVSLPAPADMPKFKAGETLSVAAEKARLMLGAATVATLPRGQRFVVVEVRDSWIGTRLSVGGQEKHGWIATSDIVAVSPTEPQVYTVLKPTETQGAPPVRSHANAVYSDDYLYGYYVRHETDPNMHVWEPWRH
jgi:hypothetical protein